MKTFVLDTNVLLHNSSSLFSFGKNKVVVPITVIEELDKFKRASDEKGRHARAVARLLDELREKGPLNVGVSLDNGGSIQVMMAQEPDLPKGMDIHCLDNLILSTAVALANQGEDVTFISKDINARIKADALGVPSEDFESNKVNVDELYPGWRHLRAEDFDLDLEGLASDAGIPAPKLDHPLSANEFLHIGDLDTPLAYARYDKERDRLVRLDHSAAEPWGIGGLNPQQHFAIELLLDERIQLVTLVGKAGTGKTLLALAAGLQATIDLRRYRRMLVSRPVIPMGRDIGYLPGSKDEKLSHWMQPIFDNLEFIFNRYLEGEIKAEEQLDFLMESKKIELEALTYIRGRSIPGQYLIVDEAQNLTPHEVKTIVSRAGEGTKIILTGDPYQIDNPYLDASSNGLTTVVERFRNQSLFGHVSLIHSERSPLSSLAATLL